MENIVTLKGADLRFVRQELGIPEHLARPVEIRVWTGAGGVKFSIDGGMWTPLLGASHRETRRFRVTWEIDVPATSAEDAAAQALLVQCSHDRAAAMDRIDNDESVTFIVSDGGVPVEFNLTGTKELG